MSIFDEHQRQLDVAKVYFRARPLEAYPKICRIRTKQGRTVPLNLNAAQQSLLETAFTQLKKTGKVRIIVLKARQLGVSTGILAEAFRQAVLIPGTRALTLAHAQKSGRDLFEIMKRYATLGPSIILPEIGLDNTAELTFPGMDCKLRADTASNPEALRGSTYGFLHLSEAAFYKDESIIASALQMVPSDSGWVIVESTANGPSGIFYDLYMGAVRGDNGFIPVFYPWFLDAQYRVEVSEGFTLTEEEHALRTTHGLDVPQLAWRRQKLAELGGDLVTFQQEYPATALEAFRTSTTGSFVPLDAVNKARWAKAVEGGNAPLIIGVDPAHLGEDRTAIVYRRGRKVEGYETHRKLDVTEVAGLVKKIIRDKSPAKVCVDSTGLGVGVVDILRSDGFGSAVDGINSSEKPELDQDRYRNRRAECWGRMRGWFLEPPISIPDADELAADILAVGHKVDPNGKIQLASKEDIRKRTGRSPDLGDALALTFAVSVGPTLTKSSGWEALNNYDSPYDC